MILKTKIAVTFNKPMSGTETAILIGALGSRQRDGDSYFGANYIYAKETGEAIIKDAFELKSKDEIIAMNDLIKSDLPSYDQTPEPEFEELKCFYAFRLEMYNTLLPLNPELVIDDIEIDTVTEVNFV